MEFSELLSVFAALLLLIAYLLYYRKTSAGKTEPNAASWTMWVFLIALNATTYGFMTGDSIKALIGFASSLAAIAIFLNALTCGRFKQLDGWDLTALAIGIVAGFVWWVSRSATYGNLIMQVALLVSVLPTVHSAWEEPKREPPLPWFLWSIAFSGTLVVVILRWQGQLQDLIYPIQGVVWHAVVGVLALRQHQK